MLSDEPPAPSLAALPSGLVSQLFVVLVRSLLFSFPPP